MRKLTVWLVMIAALSVFTVNALAKTSDGMTPAEESVCDILKEEGVSKGLYGLCVSYCEAIDGPAEIIQGAELDKLKPPEPLLLAIYQKKMREGDPEMPCVNYVGACPVWTQEELDRIGTLGGTKLLDYEYSGVYENFYDGEEGSGFKHFSQVVGAGHLLMGQYYSGGTGFPNAYRFMALTEDEYNSCKQMLIEHVTQH